MTLESRKRWVVPKEKNEKDILKTVLRNRGLDENFLKLDLDDIPSFKKLFDTKIAAKKIIKAAKDGKKIFIHGDYDVDGISATAILWECIYYDLAEKIGKKIDITPYIPDRVDEGYGLSESSLSAMIEQGAQLIITVDCGIRDGERVKKYISNDLDIIVTDHHQAPTDLTKPEYTIVHQMYPNKEYPFQQICGAFVSFLLVLAIKEEIGDESEITESTKGLDLVALATITDMMPLVGINRVVVKYGLEQLKKDSRIGISNLSRLASVEIKDLDSYHLGFVIGPRLNAAGRIGKAMDALKLVLANNQKIAAERSAQLFNLNTLRQENTAEILSQIETILPDYQNDSLLFIHGQGWHEGVIGLAASKLFERFGKPVVITTFNGTEVKGSARSISTFNITFAIEQFSEHLTRYGGHAQAAGFSTTPEQLDEFRQKLVAYANENITPDLLEQDLNIDIALSPKDITQENLKRLEELKPFGYGNPKPMILLEKVPVVKKYILSNGKHLKIQTSNGISLMFFNANEDITKIKEGDEILVVGNVALNQWNGNTSMQIQVKEWKISA